MVASRLRKGYSIEEAAVPFRYATNGKPLTTGVYTDTGTAATVTTALDGLVFTPTANQVAPGLTVTTGFTISDKDTAGLTTTDAITTVVATDVAVPTITGTVAGQLTSDRQTTMCSSPTCDASVAIGPVAGILRVVASIV